MLSVRHVGSRMLSLNVVCAAVQISAFTDGSVEGDVPFRRGERPSRIQLSVRDATFAKSDLLALAIAAI